MVPAGAAETLAVPVAARSHEAIRPLRAPLGLDPQKVALGRKLFHDPILSADNTISCATCHPLAKGGADNLPVSLGVKGAAGTANSPTVYNTSLNLAQFWDGRATTLEEQVNGPLTHPAEMAATWPDVLARLRASAYGREFRAVYGAEPAEASVRDAIASFERSLVTLDSSFDRWLAGDDKALADEQKRGYALFKSYGCASCHQGANVGGNMFQRFGFFGNWFLDRGRSTQADLGRFNVTGKPSDKYVFKVPSLRLVTLTPPYFHDGSVADLKQAIRLMGQYQLGRDIAEPDIDLIVAFLGSLVDPARLAGP
ncbi:MAG: cytochrome-c peroxidase [Magnetospirillum sp.]|nr:cytochrome-c peroxidase [Magnetospirillum sp.]